jgi:hypothetical protein
MKMKRSQLKSLVKECLFEILIESTGQAPEALTEGRSLLSKRSNTRKPSRPGLESISYNTKQTLKSRPEPRAIDVSGITSDPVMASIFQDTAATTLPDQIAAERGAPIVGGDAASLTVSNSDPAQLFSEASQNWAALAFSESSKK